MKKLLSFILVGVLLFSPLIPYENLEAKTLRDYLNELDTMISNLASYEAQREAAKKRAAEYQYQINQSFKKIEGFSTEIQESRRKIEELNVEIEEKQKEIDELMSFFQITKGSKAYLEYIFAAQTFTDFIYRTAIVEQLSVHNDELIEEMYSLIEQNKQLQKELETKIAQEQSAIEEQKKLLASINVTIDDIDEHYVDVEAQVKGIKAEIEYLETAGCELDEDLTVCLDVPYASGFFKPVKTGAISSEFGYRTDPITGASEVYHKGIDIALPDWNPVYAAAAGKVGTLIRGAKCGGNIVYIKHTVGGKEFTTRYLHLSQINVSTGDIVTINTVIGYSGGGWTSKKRGGYDECTTGAHLHFEINRGWSGLTPINPREYIYFPSRW